jgi:polyferredoxin
MKTGDMMYMKEHAAFEKRILKAILWVYIILCVIIAGLNYGYAPHASQKAASFLTWFWHFYENWVKTFFILVCGMLTLRIARKSGRTVMRKRNLIGFLAAAMLVHIILPLLIGNKELYFFTMPLPWTTTPLQLLNEGSSFYQSRFPVWGAAGISAALLFYIIVSILVFIGTLLFGRRLQCSTLCLFNGFAAEVFDPAIPLIGKARKCGFRTQKTLKAVRLVFFCVAVLLSLWWILFLAGVHIPGDLASIGKIEVYIYLAGELMMAMFFWVAFMGRGYCFYCPLGTMLAFISKLAGQAITTSNTHCVECGRCNAACPMSIDIKTAAANGKAVRSMR